MKILIFENSKQIADRLVNLISESIGDIIFYKAGSYAEAVYFLKECRPDTVPLDLKYPGNEGIELLKKIKASDDKTVVIALLSEADEFIVRKWEQYEADFIFDKYGDFEKIPEIIKTLS
jgi:DNA-binding NarL/FixJ family response regulator